MNKLTVAVIFGGVSPEHEVSIITAVQVMKNLPENYEVIPIYVTKSGEMLTGLELKSIDSYKNLQLLNRMVKFTSINKANNQVTVKDSRISLFTKNFKKIDLIFPCFHGGVGEGGWIQGLAEFYDIPIVGTGLTGAALGMDKVAMKTAFDGANIEQAPYIWFYKSDWEKKQATFIKEITTHLKFPIFVKPSRGGSSIGTTCAKTRQELIRAIDLASALDNRIIVEEGITDAREINISVMGNAGNDLECSVCEEVFSKSEFLDFENKYLVGAKNKSMASISRKLPADIPKSISDKIITTSKLIFNLFDCAGLVRLDYLVKGNHIYCIEINTIPGLFSYYLWQRSGYSHQALLNNLITLALEKHESDKRLIKNYSSPILENIAPGGKLGSKL